MGHYDVAQICVNGHVVNSYSVKYPEHNSNFCNKCGAKTINKCTKCGADIQGTYHMDNMVNFDEFLAPSYCTNCGKAYPWIEEKLKALDDIIGLMDELSENEKEDFKESARNLTSDNPKTGLSILKIKKFSKKAGQEMWGLAKDLIVQISTEAALKGMGIKS